MDTVFIVVQSGGSYDDSWSHNIGAFLNLEKAQEYVEECKKQDQKYFEAGLELYEYAEKYKKENPIPRPVRSEFKGKNERNLLKDILQDDQKENKFQKSFISYYETFKEIREKILADLGVPENCCAFYGDRVQKSIDYEIEELPITK
jgi:hypothetical protein